MARRIPGDAGHRFEPLTERPRAKERQRPFGVLGRDEVVRNHGDAETICMQEREESLYESGLSGSDRTTYADSEGAHFSMYRGPRGTRAMGSHVQSSPSTSTR